MSAFCPKINEVSSNRILCVSLKEEIFSSAVWSHRWREGSVCLGERLGLSILHWTGVWFWSPWFCIYPTKLTPRPVEKRKKKKATTHQIHNQKCRKCHPTCLFGLMFFQVYLKISGCFKRNGKCPWQAVWSTLLKSAIWRQVWHHASLCTFESF